MATFLSYATERSLAKGERKAQFGKGAIEGVAGPESANNAAAAGVLVPLLTLVVGAILGPMAEDELRTAMQLGLGNPLYLVHSPFAVIVYVLMAAIIVVSLWLKRRRARYEASLPVTTEAITTLDEEIESHAPHPQLDRGRLSTTAVPTVRDGSGGDSP